jgi:hypothetical protein
MDLDDETFGNNGDTEAFDTFNDDTFGASADTWNEDDHENLVKLTDDELTSMEASNDFFDLGNNDAEDGDCLEPLEAINMNGQQGLVQQMAAFRHQPPPPRQPDPQRDFQPVKKGFFK